jgi:hypothetical protein
MIRTHRLPFLFSLLPLAFASLLAVNLGGKAQAHDVVPAMAAAADAWLDSLDDPQKAKAIFTFDNDERKDWHFIPKERNGLTIKEMRPEQRALAQALLNSGLSHKGYAKAVTIMSLERILWELENHAEKRDPEKYHFSIFGDPTKDKTWGWRVEGHHLSANFTIIDGRIVAGTPSFMGANPGKVMEGPRKDLRVLGEEEDLGRALMTALPEGQRKKALIATEAPAEVITAAERKVSALEAVGIPFGELAEAQKEQLWGIIEAYVGRIREELAAEDLNHIRDAGLDGILFAWAGSIEVGQPHYYRVQGPTFLLEFDNTQNGANHPHAVWRDFANDFGEDLLRKHYDAAH